MQSSRVQMIKLNLEGENEYLINVYVPNDEVQKVEFFRELKDLILEKIDPETYKVIMGGDMNTVVNNVLDNLAGKDFEQVSKSYCKESANWREMNEEFTWKRNFPYTARRLDYTFVQHSLVPNCISARHIDVAKTDHRMVCTGISVDEIGN